MKNIKNKETNITFILQKIKNSEKIIFRFFIPDLTLENKLILNYHNLSD